MDDKYDILRHPNISFTADGNGKKYFHGEVDKSVATISFEKAYDKIENSESVETSYELLSEEDIEEIYNKESEEFLNEETQKNK